MKKVFFILSIVVGIYNFGNAQITTLQNAGVTQIFRGANGLIQACNAAVDGDTIYLSGSSFTSPGNINKRLTIFGAGHYPDSTDVTNKTTIVGNFTLKENADLSYIEGIEFLNSFYTAQNESVNGFTLKRCNVNGNLEFTGNGSNLSQNCNIIGNVIVGNIVLSNATNTLISNNIIQNQLNNSSWNQVSNNIFIRSDYIFVNVTNNYIINNIFISVYNSIFYTGISNNQYKYNIFPSNSPNFGYGAFLENNYLSVNPSSIFISGAVGDNFSYSKNYHLQNPTTYVGTDGTQVGIYGGLYPYKESAVPMNPHFQVNNSATTTDNNGDLQLNIKVKAQKDKD